MNASLLRRLWWAALFFLGGVAHEMRSPLTCHAVTTRGTAVVAKRREG